MFGKAARLGGAAFLGLGTPVVLLTLAPADPVARGAAPSPLAAFEQIAPRVAQLNRGDVADLNPACESTLLTHGRPTEHAAILLHGLTSCPPQFSDIAAELHAQGWNVLIPRLPKHGSRNRRGPELPDLTAEDLSKFSEELAAIAPALGERTVVAGLSTGGVIAAATAQRYPMHRAVLIAPCFGILNSGAAGSQFLRNTAHWLPNRFLFWDARKGDALPGPDYAYTGFSTHALTEVLRFGAHVRQQTGVATREIRLIVNANDAAVDRASSLDLVEAWKRSGAAAQVYEFPKSYGLPHDLIEPRQSSYRRELVLPVVVQAISGQRSSP